MKNYFYRNSRCLVMYNTVKDKFSKKLFSLNRIVKYFFLTILSLITLVGCYSNLGDKKILGDKKSNKSKTNNFQLLVKDLNCRTRVINLNEEAYIVDLKNALQDITGLKVPEQILCYGGKIISNNYIKVSKLFEPLGFIDLTQRLKGSGDTFKFINFDRNTQPYKVFSTTAPRWRIIYSGINMEGVCNNSICDANNKRIWCNLKTTKGKQKKRYRGSIDDDEDDADEQFIDPITISSLVMCCYCPACDTKINKKTIKWFGFYNCKYDICGLNYDTDKQESNRGNSISRGNGFIYFNGSEEDMKTWYHIKVVVRNL